MPVDMWYNISKQQLETLRTRNNKVLIEIFDKRGKTESGIIVPITSENVFVPSEGIVVKIPDGVTDIKVGDKVMFEKYKGTRMVCENRQFLLLDFSYILAIIEKEN